MNQVAQIEQLFTEAVDAFNARDIDRYLATMDPNVEAHTLLAELSGTPYIGHAGLRRWWAETLESWDYQEIRLERVVSGGDQGVAMINLVGRGKASGVEIDMSLGMRFEVHGGRCTFFRIYNDREEALRDAGLS